MIYVNLFICLFLKQNMVLNSFLNKKIIVGINEETKIFLIIHEIPPRNMRLK